MTSAPSALSLPKSYICYHAAGPIHVDGKLSDAAWAAAPWTDDFVDIEGASKPLPRFRTRAKMLWDEENFYVAAELEEPQIWATLTAHDSVIFHDNDFEVFIDPDNDGCFYSELEMNALNTTWDLLLPRPYRGGGPAIDGFELKGLRTAVDIEGHLNDPRRKSKRWTVEIAYPWAAFKDIARVNLPPHDRDQWRLNFSRVEWHVDSLLKKRSGLPEDNWVWSPQGVVDMHRPESWGIVQFSVLNSGPVTLDPSPGLEERRQLLEVWEAQQRFRSTQGRWGATQEELGVHVVGLKVFVTPSFFELHLRGFRLDSTQRFFRDPE